VSLRASKGQSTVPDVRGQPAADAKAALQAADLVPAEFQVSSTEPKGTVTAQKPLPNKKVPSGSKVRINVSSGSGGGSGGTTNPTSQTMSVPNVLRLQQSTAQRRLHDAGLKAGVRYVVSGQPAGQVLGQNPGGGTTVKRGTTVVLAVSRGPNPTLTVVPDVVGKDKQTATTTLQNAGFTVQVLEVPTSTPSQSGKVLDEQPAGGTHAPDGSSVTIYVGSG
jgi:serine/threonine-protein kinase